MVMSLEETISCYWDELESIEDRDEFVKRRRELTSTFGKEEWIQFVKEYSNRNHMIPELARASKIVYNCGNASYSSLGVRKNNSSELLRIVFSEENYGVLDETKTRILMESELDGERRKIFRSFFGKNNLQRKENAIFLVNYVWEHVWKEIYEIPELITSKDIAINCGYNICNLLGEQSSDSNKLLSFVLSEQNYGILDENKSRIFLGTNSKSEVYVLTIAFFGENNPKRKENAAFLFNSVWNDSLKNKCLIPELIEGEDIRINCGEAIYSVFDVGQGCTKELIGQLFSDYRVLDREKAKIFIEYSNNKKNLTYLFLGEDNVHREKNGTFLVNHVWENVWKEKYLIPELVKPNDVILDCSRTIYSALGFDGFFSKKLLEKVISGYGVLNEEKAEQFIKRNSKGERKSLASVFFDEDNPKKEENAISLINYAWENIWKGKYDFPELIHLDDIRDTCGVTIFSPFGIKVGHKRELMKKTIEGYGILDEMKLSYLIVNYDKEKQGFKVKMNKVFFTGDYAPQNIDLYLQKYQEDNNLRLVDITQPYLRELPKPVREYVLEKQNQLPKNLPQRNKYSAYNQIHIKWNEVLEGHLIELFDKYNSCLLEERQLLWEELGITPFAARMKLAELGLIEEFKFGNGEKKSIPTYGYQYKEGYTSLEDMFLQSVSFSEGKSSIDVEAFRSPVHSQHTFIQVPVIYKGIKLENYSPEERELLSVVATYLYGPAVFEKISGDENPHFQAPDELLEPSCIVPIRTNEDTNLTAVCLRTEYCQDPGAFFDSVLKTENLELYQFVHKNPGKIIS